MSNLNYAFGDARRRSGEFTAHHLEPVLNAGDAVFGAIEAFNRFIDNVMVSAIARYRRHVTIKQLSELVDWRLDDIGLKRDDIRRTADEIQMTSNWRSFR